jgi:hypothetical protein
MDSTAISGIQTAKYQAGMSLAPHPAEVSMISRTESLHELSSTAANGGLSHHYAKPGSQLPVRTLFRRI